MEVWKLTQQEEAGLRAFGGDANKAQERKKQAYIESGGAILNPDALAALYEACKEVAKAYKCSPTSMQPLFWLRCVQALAKAEVKR